MKIYAAAFIAAMAAISQSAHAQKWTGLHIAIGAGAERASGNADALAVAVGFDNPIYAGRALPAGVVTAPNQINYLDSRATGDTSLNDAAAFATVEVGYDYRLNRTVVVGAFASVDVGAKKQDALSGTGTWQLVEAGGTLPLPGYRVAHQGTSTLAGQISTRDAITVGARVGYLLAPKAMAYLLGGYSTTHANLRFAIDVPQLALASRYLAMRESSWRDGYTLGAGVEAKLNKQFSAKLEYRHSDFGSYGFSADENFVVPVSQAYPYRLEGDVIGGMKAGSLRSDSLRLLLSLRL